MSSESSRNSGGWKDYPEPETVPEEEERPQQPSNQFQNDGSFMEMFRKRMEEQQKDNKPVTKAAAKPSEPKPSTAASTSVTKEPEAEATFYSTQTMHYKNDAENSSSSKKPQYQVTTVPVKALV